MNEKKLLEKLIAIRRQIHRYPELGNQEFKTASFIEKNLRELKIPHQRVNQTGILATIQGKNSQCVALRADMDALPLTEKRKSAYASKIPGVMHACGHDAHVAMLLGAAALLAEKNDLGGTVKFFFQPNEEGAGGAKEMIKKGVMKGVQAVFGLHVNPRYPSGTVALKGGPLMAAVGKFSIDIIGQGGHAAYPHEGKDAVPIACEIVQALQTIASRKIDPIEPVVVTIGTIHGGTRFNILADKVSLTGTVRTLSEKIHRTIPKLIEQIARGVAQAHGARIEFKYEILGSVLSNSKAETDFARETAVKLVGGKRVLNLKSASMGGEDFAEYLQLAPGCFIYIGVGSRSLRTETPWHHPEFGLDESAMPVGSKLLAALCEEYFKRGI